MSKLQKRRTLPRKPLPAPKPPPPVPDEDDEPTLKVTEEFGENTFAGALSIVKRVLAEVDGPPKKKPKKP